MAARPHYCAPCKAQTPAVLVLTQTARRVEGRKIFVCPAHAGTLDALRTSVAGVSDRTAEIGRRTTAARQTAEAAVWETTQDDAAATAEAYAAARPAAERHAAQYLTGEIFERFERAARRGACQTERDALCDTMVFGFVSRVADRIMRWEPVCVETVVRTLVLSNTSERARRADLSFDAVNGGTEDRDGVTLLDGLAGVDVDLSERAACVEIAQTFALDAGPMGDAARAYLAEIA